MRRYQRFLPYGVAIASTAIALLLTLCVEPFLLRTIGAFFYITIIVSAWYGGFRPGSVAVVLSTLAISYFFIPPRYQLWTERPENVFQLAIFLLVAFTINLLTSNFQDSKQKIERKISSGKCRATADGSVCGTDGDVELGDSNGRN
jgi:K+-sensing histidine kinase KdpD